MIRSTTKSRTAKWGADVRPTFSSSSHRTASPAFTGLIGMRARDVCPSELVGCADEGRTRIGLGQHVGSRTKEGLARKCKDCVSEYDRARYLANREAAIERAKLWQESNREDEAAISRRWYTGHRESASEAVMRWNVANRDGSRKIKLKAVQRRR